MSEADITVLKKALEVLYSFRSGRPDEKDFQYVEFQKKIDGELPSNMLMIGWLHYLLYNHYGIKIDAKQFGNQIMPTLLRDDLIKIFIVADEKWSRILTDSHIEGKGFPVSDFPIAITDKGISFLGKRVSDTFSFDNSKGALIFKGDECILPAFKNEHDFCNFAFAKYDVNQPFDWDVAYESMTGDGVSDKTKNRRAIYDATEAINARVKKKWGVNKLFKWEGKAIRRLQ